MPSVINDLLEDAQQWTSLHQGLQKHVATSHEFVRALEDYEYLCDEVRVCEEVSEENPPAKNRVSRKEPKSNSTIPPFRVTVHPKGGFKFRQLPKRKRNNKGKAGIQDQDASSSKTSVRSLKAIQTLLADTEKLQKCQERINALDKATKEMIQLVCRKSNRNFGHLTIVLAN
jgi:hypothetical protein